jgi:hypothetical protein
MQAAGRTATLGAYRHGNSVPWVPGALIDVWVPCARGEVVTGVPSPHVYFVQTRGGGSADSGSIHCPLCRSELGVVPRGSQAVQAVQAAQPVQLTQSALPF